eukprot:9479216-Pyramimonas_sp.AAC.1
MAPSPCHRTVIYQHSTSTSTSDASTQSSSRIRDASPSEGWEGGARSTIVLTPREGLGAITISKRARSGDLGAQ